MQINKCHIVKRTPVLDVAHMPYQQRELAFSMWHPLMFDSMALNLQRLVRSRQSRTKDVRQVKLSMESLILAQDERWRRALCMQVERELVHS